MRAVLLVGIGGGAGSIARFLVSRMMGAEPGFPWATLAVNVAGSFVIGLIAGLWATSLNDSVRLGLVVGFLGGFTTFSAFSTETVSLMRGGSAALGLVNVVGSVVAGVVAALAGVLAGEALAS